jgi:hypothetical protein
MPLFLLVARPALGYAERRTNEAEAAMKRLFLISAGLAALLTAALTIFFPGQDTLSIVFLWLTATVMISLWWMVKLKKQVLAHTQQQAQQPKAPGVPDNSPKP